MGERRRRIGRQLGFQRGEILIPPHIEVIRPSPRMPPIACPATTSEIGYLDRPAHIAGLLG
jgi:hypothetical protein